VSLPCSVCIVEVGPRDGLQNEQSIIPLATKLALIEALAEAGLTIVEMGRSVSAKRVPQMADSGEVMRPLISTDTGSRGNMDVSALWR